MESTKRQIPKPFEIYKHFKGKLYQILNIATHSETGEALVIYQALYGDFGVYARPLDMFLSKVDRNKYPDSKEEYRFTKVKLVSKETSSSVVKEIPTSITKDETASPAYNEISISSKPIIGVLSEEDQLKRAQELFIEFLDEDDFTKKRNILKAISGIATNSMINNMAASLDLVTSGVSRDNDIKMIDDYIRTRIHFDGSRLRKRPN